MIQRPFQTAFSTLLPILFALAIAAAAAIAPPAAHAGEGLVEGRDYVGIAGGQPLLVEPGKVEVVAVFAYWCHHCANFHPALSAWAGRQPADVAFRYLPAAFTLDDTAARAYFAAESLGVVEQTHEASYRAIHAEYSLPSRGASMEEYAGLYAGLGLGLDSAALLAAMRSPQTDARMVAARDFIRSAGVEGTPTIIVDGRYRVLGGSFAEILRNTGLLVARQRAAAGTGSTSAPEESRP